MKSSDLQSLIDWDAILPMERCAGGHDQQMQALFKGATVLAHWNENDFQGTVATAVKLADGRYCWYQDSYGSCCGCDAWEDADDTDVRRLCIGLAIDANVFDSLADMIGDMKANRAESWRANAGHALADMLEQPSV